MGGSGFLYMVSKNNSKRNIDVEFRIMDRWRLNFEFIVCNIWLIMFALLLFFFNVLHSHRGILGYDVGSNYKLYFTLPFTMVIILVPSSILLYFLYLLRKRVQVSLFVFLEKVAILVLLVIGLVTQSVSSWMSFESFFSLMFEHTINDVVLSFKNSQSSKEKNILKRLSEREKILKDEISNIDIKIKNNDDRIEIAKNKHLSLDYTYKTMKQDYMKEIENARRENKDLFAQKNEYLKSLDDLGSQFDALVVKKDFYNNRIKAINVLDGTSVVINKNDYSNIIFVYLLLLLSICLDIFLVMVFCIIQNSYHKFCERKLLFLYDGIKCSSCSKSSVNQKVQNHGQISSLEAKEISANNIVDESLKFIASNLEPDRRTIKSLIQINQDTNVSHYKIRKYLLDLMDRGLVIKDKKRLVLVNNIDNMY
ncbi:Hypothetical protein BCD_1110 (plasmid) [Borrelia crocidurae DOU]|uniref:Uncharacterized protein n=2 Tax=Borrelia crocidurae TaxID=29520 RepID=W5SPZ9_9SPIR|nr:Hypothetical protein BCD_1110 [Borrelia crocidurae DOU]